MRPSSRASSSLVPTPSVQVTSIGSRIPAGRGCAAANPVWPPAMSDAIAAVWRPAASRLTPASR